VAVAAVAKITERQSLPDLHYWAAAAARREAERQLAMLILPALPVAAQVQRPAPG
jgi:hypothetical protein